MKVGLFIGIRQVAEVLEARHIFRAKLDGAESGTVLFVKMVEGGILPRRAVVEIGVVDGEVSQVKHWKLFMDRVMSLEIDRKPVDEARHFGLEERVYGVALQNTCPGALWRRLRA